MNRKAVTLDYTNWKGERDLRHVIPLGLWYGVSPFHEQDGEQYYIRAFDLGRGAYRDFSLKSVHSATPYVCPPGENPVALPADLPPSSLEFDIRGGEGMVR